MILYPKSGSVDAQRIVTFSIEKTFTFVRLAGERGIEFAFRRINTIEGPKIVTVFFASKSELTHLGIDLGEPLKTFVLSECIECEPTVRLIMDLTYELSEKTNVLDQSVGVTAGRPSKQENFFQTDFIHLGR